MNPTIEIPNQPYGLTRQVNDPNFRERHEEEKYYLQIPIQGGDPIRILIGSTSSTFAGNQLYGQEFEFTNQDFQQESLINQPIVGCINITSLSRL